MQNLQATLAIRSQSGFKVWKTCFPALVLYFSHKWLEDGRRSACHVQCLSTRANVNSTLSFLALRHFLRPLECDACKPPLLV